MTILYVQRLAMSIVWFTGLAEGCCVCQRNKLGTLLVNWTPADSLPPRSISQQGNQSGLYESFVHEKAQRASAFYF